MSSGLDTVTRRQIRKAMGPSCLTVMEAHEQGLLGHSHSIEMLEETLRNQSRWISSVEEQQRDLRVDAIVQFRDRGFLGRLSWLLRGK